MTRSFRTSRDRAPAPRARTLAPAAAVLAFVALAPSARADDISLMVFKPTPATTGTGFQLQSPDVGAAGSWVASSILSYASNPLVLDTPAGGMTPDVPVEHSALLQLGVAYALGGRIEIGGHLPLYLQSGELDATSLALRLPPASGTALGNLTLHGKARLVRGDNRLGAFTAGASAIAVLPTASAGQFTGSDSLEARLLLLGSFAPAALGSRLTLSANAGAIARGESRYADIVQKSGLAWGAGASYRVVGSVSAVAELFGETTPSGHVSSDDPMSPATTLSQIEWLAGLRFRPDRRLTVGLAAGRGLTSAFGTPDLRAVVSLAFVPGSGAAP